jgi:hypothetical protein
MPEQFTIAISTCTEPRDFFNNIPAEYEAFFALRDWVQSGRVRGTAEAPDLYGAEVSRAQLTAFVNEAIGSIVNAYSSPGGDYAKKSLAELQAWIAAKPADTRFRLTGGTL